MALERKIYPLWSRLKSFISDPHSRDETLHRLSLKKVGPASADFLKLLGSNELKVQYFDPIFDTQVRRNQLPAEKAAKLRQIILDGKANLFIQDQLVGNISSWIIEKSLTPAVALATAKAGYPELIPITVAIYWSTNITAIPYFIPRAIQEFRHQQQLLQEKTSEEKRSHLLRSALELSCAVLLNATPASPAAIPLLNRQRYRGLSKTYLDYQITNAREFIDKTRSAISQKFTT